MKARVIAFYLPQYYPVKENDEMWGKGFTEWRNVAKAKPLFWGHYQPQLPADLGFYDLRIPEIREEQVELAKEAGIEGFCYWHYWFGNGRRILERPFEEVLKSGKPDFPFCLGWANHSWSNRTWQKLDRFQKDVVFIEQQYLGDEDYIAHFYEVLTAFKDKRYITVDNKPLFLIYAPEDIPNVEHFIKLWNKLAIENGLAGIHFVARVASTGKLNPGISKRKMMESVNERYNKFIDKGFNAISSSTLKQADILTKGYYKKMFNLLLERKAIQFGIEKYDYSKIIKNLYHKEDMREDVYPQLIPRWDKTPRKGRDAQIYYNSTPENFRKSIKYALKRIEHKPEEKKILFLFAWNEWGEGAYLEPDIKYGKQYIDVLREELSGNKNECCSSDSYL